MVVWSHLVKNLLSSRLLQIFREVDRLVLLSDPVFLVMYRNWQQHYPQYSTAV